MQKKNNNYQLKKQVMKNSILILAVLILATIKLPAQSESGYKIYIKNNTRKTIWVAFRYKDYSSGNGYWKTKAWYKIKPRKEIYVAKTANRYIYTYAETKVNAFGNFWYWGGSHGKRINGKYFKMKEWLIPSDRRFSDPFRIEFN